MTEYLTAKSATDLAALIRTRKVSAAEVVAAQLHRIEQVNPSVNAIVTIAPDALDLAVAVDNGPTGKHEFRCFRQRDTCIGR